MYGRGLRRRLPPCSAATRQDPDGVLPDVLAAGHPGALLRRGDRDGRGPARRRAARPSAPPCSGTTPKTAASRPPRRGTSCAQPVDGPFGPAHINAAAAKRDPGFAVELHRDADPAVPGMSRARLGQVCPHQAGLTGGVAAPLHVGRLHGGGRPQFRRRAGVCDGLGGPAGGRGRRPGGSGREGRGGAVLRRGRASGICSAARTSRSPTTAPSKSGAATATGTGGSGSSARANASSPEGARSPDGGRYPLRPRKLTGPLPCRNAGATLAQDTGSAGKQQAPSSSPGGPAMLKEAKAHVTRVRALDQLHRGDEIEARL